MASRLKRNRRREDAVILGAGLTGLATARFLPKNMSCAVYEREDRVGGLARSYRADGYTCDMTGHLLHLRRPDCRALVKRLLRGNLVHVERKSSIHSHGSTTEYPFQANLHGLPPEVRQECLLGFAAVWRRDRREGGFHGSFKRWIMDTFGEGIARHFMIPYNEKLWRCGLDTMTSEWVSWSVPQPSLEEVVRGTLAPQTARFGYNPDFFYPAEGGIGAFSAALAAPVREAVRTGMSAVEVNLARREVRFSDASIQPYSRLVTTLPLPAFLRMVKDAPAEMKRLAGRLRFVNVLTFNMGFRGSRRCESHWTYFPEKEFPFYRVGFPSNFAPALAPKGHCSAYVEVSYPPGRRPRLASLYPKVVEGLRRWGVIRSERDIAMVDPQFIEPAYVIFDRERGRSVARLRSWLEQRDVFSAGRYGNWDYLSMEDSLRIGGELAATLAN